MMVYDITREETYESLPKWMDELREHAETGLSVMILGNKTDLESQRKVRTEDASEYAR
jgi:GTPase SAR1 family protein